MGPLKSTVNLIESLRWANVAIFLILWNAMCVETSEILWSYKGFLLGVKNVCMYVTDILLQNSYASQNNAV